MQELRQSTSGQVVTIGHALDSTDGDSEENSLTITNTDIKINKHNTTTLVNKNSGGATNISNGVYHTTLNATDTNTAGRMTVYVHVAGALAMKEQFMVLTASAFDAKYTGTFNNLGGTAQTGDSFARIGVNGAGLTAINLPNQTMDITGNITGDLSGSVGSVTGGATSASQTTAQNDLNTITGSDGVTLATAQALYAPAKAGDSMDVSSIGNNVITALSINANALDGKGDWNINKTGYSISGTISTLDGLNNFNVASEQVIVSTNNDKTGYSLSATGLDSILSTSIGMVEIAKAIWDRVLTGITHNITNSAGKRVRDVIDSVVIFTDTAVSGTINTVTLPAGASSTDGAYDPSDITIVGGTGSGQSRLVLEYDGTTKIAVVDRNWKVTPDATSVITITTNPGREHVNEGLAQAGTANTITLNTLASSINDVYIGQIVFIRSGTGDDQAGIVTDYDGTTKIATLDKNWGVTPDATSAYVMIPASPVILASTTHTGAIIPIVSALTGHTPQTADHTAAIAATATSAEITALTNVVDDLAIKKNVIFSNFEFLMVLTSDHATPATGLTVTGERSINGGAFVSVSGAISEVSNGIYNFNALTVDTNGDVITWRFIAATADDTFMTFKTVQ